ncbi:hypothetical protein, conserved [Eimeria praecox]|uniref:Uncharacterized protein n=1 Tax=Eimeria praecox TaxID=51316 RepID=U6H2I0_9EIME|nr:hypothetical protein, conserved [Eimeria praecox]
MRGRIMSIIGERVPLELLTHRPLSPAQLAEIQVLLSSRSIANFAFTFCHLVHWVAFGQTQPDAPQDSKDDEAHGTKECVERQEADNDPAPNSSTPPNEAIPETEPTTVKEDSWPYEEVIGSNKGQESFKKESPDLMVEEPQSQTLVQPDSPGNILKQELMHLRGAEGSSGSLVGGSFSRVVRRYGVLQHPSEAKPIGEAHGQSSYEEFHAPLNTCRKRLKVLAAAEAAYHDVMDKIKEAVAWALRQHLPKLLRHRALQLELADRINALFSQLFDPEGYFSRQCTQKIESEVKHLQDEVCKQPSFLHLKQESQAVLGELPLKEEDPQHKLLRLQKEQQELLSQLDPKAFDPISNWKCPGTLPRLPQEPQRQSVGPLSTMSSKLHSKVGELLNVVGVQPGMKEDVLQRLTHMPRPQNRKEEFKGLQGKGDLLEDIKACDKAAQQKFHRKLIGTFQQHHGEKQQPHRQRPQQATVSRLKGSGATFTGRLA